MGFDPTSVGTHGGPGRGPLSLEQIASLLEAAERLVVAELESLGDELDRHAVHAEAGVLTVSGLLHEWVFHDRNHIRQLLANAQARVWPAMDGSRRFTDIHG